MDASLSLPLKMQFVVSVVATDVFKSEQCYSPAHHSSLGRATVLTDDVLIYGTLNQLSEALSSISLSLPLSHNLSPPVGLLSYQDLSARPVVCFPKAIQHIWLQLEI